MKFENINQIENRKTTFKIYMTTAAWLTTVVTSLSIVIGIWAIPGRSLDFLFLLSQSQFLVCVLLIAAVHRWLNFFYVYPLLKPVYQFYICLFVFFSLMTVYLVLGKHSINPASEKIFFHLECILYQILLIAFVEETIFREVPARIFKKNIHLFYVLSSILFALYHINHGIELLPFFAAFGLLFAILRSNGIGLIGLIFVHGALNISNLCLFPFIDFRFGSIVFAWIGPLLVLVVISLSGIALSAFRKRQMER